MLKAKITHPRHGLMSFKAVQVQRGADLDHLSKNDPASSAGSTKKLRSTKLSCGTACLALMNHRALTLLSSSHLPSWGNMELTSDWRTHIACPGMVLGRAPYMQSAMLLKFRIPNSTFRIWAL